MTHMRRARGVLKINPRQFASVTGRANTMCAGIDNNPTLFPNPTVPTSAIKAQVAVVTAAATVAATRAKGAAAARDVQVHILVGMMETDAIYIQSVADKAATWDAAASTLQAGGLVVAAVGQQNKAVLTLKQGAASGTVDMFANESILTANLRGGYFFNWSFSSDGKTWSNLGSTPKARTSLANLTPLTTYSFRVSVTNSDGIPGEWSQAVSFMVH